MPSIKRGAALALYRGWSELELALSGLLYEVLHLRNKGSLLANVIYFSPTSQRRAARPEKTYCSKQVIRGGLLEEIALTTNVMNHPG